MQFALKVSPGVEIRLFELRDAEPAFTVVERNRAYLREWLPWVDLTTAPENLRHFIVRVREQFETGRGPQALIWVNGEIVGSVGCHPIDWPNKNCSIGYWIDEKCQGKGIMTRCAARLIDYLFADLGLHRVTIHCGTQNVKSCAIPERLGFTREGVIRQGEWVNDRWLDLVVWGLLESEWKGQPTSPQRGSRP